MRKVTSARISSIFTFQFGRERGQSVEVRVDDRPHRVSTTEAFDIARAVMDAGGLLCAECLNERLIRYVLTDAPTVAMCWDCYDRKTTTGAHY